MSKKLLVFFVIGFFFGSGVFFIAQAQSSIPNSIVVTATSSCAIQLDWTQSASATSTSFDFKISVDGSLFSSPISIPELGYEPAPDDTPPFLGSGNFIYTRTKQLPTQSPQAYKLQALVGGTWSDWSVSYSANLPIIDSPPAPPTTIQATEWDSSGRVVLTWTPGIEPYSGFRVLRSDFIGDSWTLFSPVAHGTFSLGKFQGDGNKWPDSISSSTTYKYTIQAYQTAAFCQTVDHSTNSDPTIAPWVNFSAPSNELIVPKSPPNLRIVDTRSDDLEIIFGWDDIDNETTYYFQVSATSDFSTLHFSDTYLADITDTDHFISFVSSVTYYYRIKACKVTGLNEGCSAFSPVENFTAGHGPPTNLQARIAFSSLADEEADVYLTWDDVQSYSRTALVYRRVVGEGWSDPTELEPALCNAIPSPPQEYRDRNVPINTNYEYKVAFNILDVSTGEVPCPFSPDDSITASISSNVEPINLNITKVLGGYAWSTVDAGPIGIGWINFSNPTPVSNRYSVQVDDTGLMSGYAWANDYGWLSFNKYDVVVCPSGSCPAMLDDASGELSGWAKFLASSQSDGAWTGWVHLSKRDGGGVLYGVCYGTAGNPTGVSCNGDGSATGILSGWAWGGDITGWFRFDPRDSSGNPRGGVTVNTEIIPPSDFQGFFDASNQLIRLDWVNEDYYQGTSPSIEIYRDVNADFTSGFLLPESATSSSIMPGGTPNSFEDKLSNNDLNTDYWYQLRVYKGTEFATSSIIGPISTFLEYSLFCAPNPGGTSINLYWFGNVPIAHTIDIYATTTVAGFFGNPTVIAVSSTTKAYNVIGFPPTPDDDRLISDTAYKFKITIVDAGGFDLRDSNEVECSTTAPTPNDPSTLTVVPNTSSSLYLAWRDNAVDPHYFRIERIKLTPKTPTSLVAALSENTVDLNWTNATTTYNLFYHIIEYANTTSGDLSPDGDDFAVINSYVPQEDIDFSHSVDDPNLDHYYRIKTCSAIRLEAACSDYITSNSVTTVMSSPNFYARAVNLFQSLFRKTTNFFSSLNFESISAQGSPYEIHFKEISTNVDEPIFTDFSLDPNSSYLYRVQLCLTSGGCSAYTGEAWATTLKNCTSADQRVCLGNNRCGIIPGCSEGFTDPDYNMCDFNSECQNVGRFDQSFQEAKP